jgi:hypothetical protein
MINKMINKKTKNKVIKKTKINVMKKEKKRDTVKKYKYSSVKNGGSFPKFLKNFGAKVSKKLRFQSKSGKYTLPLNTLPPHNKTPVNYTELVKSLSEPEPNKKPVLNSYAKRFNNLQRAKNLQFLFEYANKNPYLLYNYIQNLDSVSSHAKSDFLEKYPGIIEKIRKTNPLNHINSTSELNSSPGPLSHPYSKIHENEEIRLQNIFNKQQKNPQLKALQIQEAQNLKNLFGKQDTPTLLEYAKTHPNELLKYIQNLDLKSNNAKSKFLTKNPGLIEKVYNSIQQQEKYLQNKNKEKYFNNKNIQGLLLGKRPAPKIPDTNSDTFTYIDNPLFQNPQMFIKQNPQEVLDFIKKLDYISNNARPDFLNKHPNILNQINNSIRENRFGFNEKYTI